MNIRSLYRRPPEAADSLDWPLWNLVKQHWMASVMASEADLLGEEFRLGPKGGLGRICRSRNADSNTVTTSYNTARRDASWSNSSSNAHQSQSLLGSEAITQEDNSLFVCPRCCKVYQLYHSLRRHMRVECGQEPRHACPNCGRRFKHRFNLTVHIRNWAYLRYDHIDGDEQWINALSWIPEGSDMDQSQPPTESVSLSNRQLVGLDLLPNKAVQVLQAGRLITEDTPFVCERCHKRYAWKDSLRRHQRVECGLEPQHSCPDCGRMFKHKHQMVSHRRIHDHQPN
ncbi:hypothetical protein ANN_25161 [Periplaneta americana]|uniref:C2H2-type domain-containing protein n=1 Tax=Periplaneta americana TaxID=6978 RepID=A0ABQ8S0I5_PERAM|nr:hypothetical protein ANN_25161 [Periplaneta americana]